MAKFVIFFLTAIIGTSCSMIRRTALRTTTAIMQEGSGFINYEGSWDNFQKSAPANLTTLEGFWFADQSNTDLLALLIKGHAGLGFGVYETQALDDQLKDKDKSEAKDKAIQHYTKAYDYGIRYMQEKGITEENLLDREAATSLVKILNEKLNEEDMIATFYFAQAWGGLINLQRTNVALMSKLGSIKVLMDWVCGKNPNFELGSCNLFYAVYEAGRPAMLGGNLQKGRDIFEKFIKNSPLNLLARVSFIQYYIVPTMDETLYAQHAEFLKRELVLWEETLNLGTRKKTNRKYLKNKEFNLFNSIAKKRFEIIEKNKDEIF